GVDRRDRRRDVGDITETNGNTSGGSLHDNLAELLRRSNLPADQTENQLMIIFDETGRVDQIGPADGLENIADDAARSEQARPLRRRRAATSGSCRPSSRRKDRSPPSRGW